MPKGKSRSAVYYQANKKARDKKKKYDSELNRRPEQVRKRSELTTERRRRGIDGKGGKDVGHTKNGFRMQDPSKNRGSSKNMPGDKRARGKKKK